MRWKISSSRELSWMSGKCFVVAFHITVLAVMLDLATFWGDAVDIGTVLIYMPFVFLFHYRNNDLTVGLFCFSIYLSIIGALDRISGYPYYKQWYDFERFLEPLFEVIVFGWILCLIINFFIRRNKRVFILTFSSLFIFYSQILQIFPIVIRQIKGGDLINISLLNPYCKQPGTKIFFTKITSEKVYGLVEEKPRNWNVFYFQRNEDKTIDKEGNWTRGCISIGEQQINSTSWQRFIFSRNIAQ
jgi:hypothetical protein